MRSYALEVSPKVAAHLHSHFVQVAQQRAPAASRKLERAWPYKRVAPMGKAPYKHPHKRRAFSAIMISLFLYV